MLDIRDIDFSWGPPGQHEWVTARRVDETGVAQHEEEILVCKTQRWSASAGPLVRDGVNLVRNSGWFLELSDQSTTWFDRDAYLSFADEHGAIHYDDWAITGDEARLQLPVGTSPADRFSIRGPSGYKKLFGEAVEELVSNGTLVVGCSILSWGLTQIRLRLATRLWRFAKEKDRAALEKMHRPTNTGFRFVLDDLEVSRPDEFWRHVAPFDLKVEGSDSLCDLARSFAFVIIQANNVASVSVAFRTEKRVVIRPRTLIDAIWLQFALAFSEDKSYRECLICGRPFEVSLDAFRTNRTLCSDACKSKAYRLRKSQARSMRTAGKPLREIAKTLGSDLKTIKSWLGNNNG